MLRIWDSAQHEAETGSQEQQPATSHHTRAITLASLPLGLGLGPADGGAEASPGCAAPGASCCLAGDAAPVAPGAASPAAAIAPAQKAHSGAMHPCLQEGRGQQEITTTQRRLGAHTRSTVQVQLKHGDPSPDAAASCAMERPPTWGLGCATPTASGCTCSPHTRALAVSVYWPRQRHGAAAYASTRAACFLPAPHKLCQWAPGASTSRESAVPSRSRQDLALPPLNTTEHLALYPPHPTPHPTLPTHTPAPTSLPSSSSAAVLPHPPPHPPGTPAPVSASSWPAAKTRRGRGGGVFRERAQRMRGGAGAMHTRATRQVGAAEGRAAYFSHCSARPLRTADPRLLLEPWPSAPLLTF